MSSLLTCGIGAALLYVAIDIAAGLGYSGYSERFVGQAPRGRLCSAQASIPTGPTGGLRRLAPYHGV